MTDGTAGRPVGWRQGDYVWDGSQWVPHRDGTGNTFDGRNWNRPPQPPFPSTPLSAPFFADPRYAYGFTRQTSDDLQFIARYTKIVIIVTLVLGAAGLILNLIFLGSIFAILDALTRLLPR
ncbi:MAG: hypothetical protein AAGC63_02495 [Propionicimonas sp.]|nr:hypothetical protein [Propionicimonas sp.]